MEANKSYMIKTLNKMDANINSFTVYKIRHENDGIHAYIANPFLCCTNLVAF